MAQSTRTLGQLSSSSYERVSDSVIQEGGEGLG
jgi:hypothetical protein